MILHCQAYLLAKVGNSVKCYTWDTCDPNKYMLEDNLNICWNLWFFAKSARELIRIPRQKQIAT